MTRRRPRAGEGGAAARATYFAASVLPAPPSAPLTAIGTTAKNVPETGIRCWDHHGSQAGLKRLCQKNQAVMQPAIHPPINPAHVTEVHRVRVE